MLNVRILSAFSFRDGTCVNGISLHDAPDIDAALRLPYMTAEA